MKSLLILFLLGLSAASEAQVDCVAPKLKLPSECGVITDLSGVPIPQATVIVGWADVGSSTKTDNKGRWGFLSNTKNSGWLQIEAPGFQTARFEYATQGKSVEVCRKPVYIRLITGLEGCPVVTLNAKRGIKR